MIVFDQSSGGLELLFSNQRKHRIDLPQKDDQGHVANLAFLVKYLCENLLKDRRKEMFILDGTVSVKFLFDETDTVISNISLGGQEYSY